MFFSTVVALSVCQFATHYLNRGSGSVLWKLPQVIQLNNRLVVISIKHCHSPCLHLCPDHKRLLQPQDFPAAAAAGPLPRPQKTFATTRLSCSSSRTFAQTTKDFCNHKTFLQQQESLVVGQQESLVVAPCCHCIVTETENKEKNKSCHWAQPLVAPEHCKGSWASNWGVQLGI